MKFEQYEKLIKKIAWETAKKYHADYDDLYQQGCLIYCECLEKYDVTKSSFSTFLFIKIHWGLKDYCLRLKREVTNCDLKLSLIEDRRNFESAKQILENAISELSKDAFELFEWLLGRSWDREGRRKPCYITAVQDLNWSRKRVKMAWDECKSYWSLIR